MSTTLLLVDPQEIFREGLCLLLKKRREVQVVATASDEAVALRLAQELAPAVIVLGLAGPSAAGIDMISKLHDLHPAIKVLVTANHPDRPMVLEALKAGAMGLLDKDSSLDELCQAITFLADGKMYLSPAITGLVVNECIQHLFRGNEPTHTLTDLEWEILERLAAGKSPKEIALGRRLSHKTVELHRRRIMEKLNLHSIAELTKYAIRSGIATVDA